MNDWVIRAPDPRLRPAVDRYVGYRMTGFAPGLHRGLPSRYMTFIVSIGPPINVVAQTNPVQAPAVYRTAVGGLQASPAMVAHDGNQQGVAVELTPPGSRTLFGAPSSALWDRTLELADIAGRPGLELWERLQSAITWEERFSAVDDVLVRLIRATAPHPEIQHSWATLVASGGQIRVDELAHKTGYSRQQLARKFQEEFGLSPKLAARIVRFERARRMIQGAARQLPFAEVAAACGYYDEAHLYRDFARFAGCTPTELLREDASFVQDSRSQDGGWWLHDH